MTFHVSPVIMCGAMNERPDPIHRESALALEALKGGESISWIATLLEIRCLPETTR